MCFAFSCAERYFVHIMLIRFFLNYFFTYHLAKKTSMPVGKASESITMLVKL